MALSVLSATRIDPYLFRAGETNCAVWTRENARITFKNLSVQTGGSQWAHGKGSAKMDIPNQVVRAMQLQNIPDNVIRDTLPLIAFTDVQADAFKTNAEEAEKEEAEKHVTEGTKHKK